MSTVEASVFRNPSSLVDQIVLEADGTFGGGLASTFLPIAGGKILQIVRATDATERTTTSTSFVDVTGMSVTITPQKSDSAILIISTFYALTSWSTGDTGYGFYAISDSSNNIVLGGGATPFGTLNLSGSGGRAVFSGLTLIGYSTPATLSATTYKLRFRSETANVTTFTRNADQRGQMLAIEISA